MAKPKIEVENEKYFRDIHFLYEILNSLKNLDEVKGFFKDILTPSELRMLKRRWHVANLIVEGRGIREIASESQTSTQTVSKIKAKLEEGSGGLRLAVEKAKKNIKKEQGQKSNRITKGSKFVKNWF
ncbi:MAG: hypothetical protein COU27_02325 [Candidatus Levybacteria bacterium CG10_big_fil_rev_8_21_14_0_10_36_7]|nr:MAG: hypothetical protein COU27_02325 [Candidatus Levybacteria bacterium CG10_big_fil_rev_8_21_14_0_10_36_7]